LTSKYGLCRSLKTLIWYEDADIDTFYPRYKYRYKIFK
jgi:hypothetical protein